MFVPIDRGDDKPWCVVIGPFRDGSLWIDGQTRLENFYDEGLSVSLSRLTLTRTFVQTVFITFLDGVLGKAEERTYALFEDWVENVRRIGAALAMQFAEWNDNEAVSFARSFSRIKPLREFVRRLSPQGLSSCFHNLTERLPIGFHLVDLLARSLIPPTKYNPICKEIFRQEKPDQCVISDLKELWSAILHFEQPSTLDLEEYQCPGGFTEIFAPIFSNRLAVGAVFAGQLVKSEDQKQIVIERCRNARPCFTVENWNQSFHICKDIKEVINVCSGLSSLTGATFDQWCRAESEAELREALIKASMCPSFRDFANEACRSIVRYLDVTECSLWLHKDNRLVLLASTAEQFYTRQEGGLPIVKKRDELIDQASYELGEGLTGIVAKTRKAIRVSNAKHASGWAGKYSETPLNRDAAFMAFPLLRQGDLIGVFRASKVGDSTTISDCDQALSNAVANEMAIIIREKQFSESARELAEHFKYINQVSAHEYRSPLQNILSQVEMVKRSLRTETPEIKDRLHIIEEQSFRAKRQLDNALTIDIDLAYDFKHSRLGSLFQGVENEFIMQAAERNIRIIVWDSAKKLPAIQMDECRIAQVITNLIDNAVKYSFRGEHIHIRGWEGLDSVRIHIENRGTGIPEQYRHTIFRPFERKVVEDRTRFIAGTGLGLPIVHQIVYAHRGLVTFTSVPFLDDPQRQGPEHGHIVTFTVELPKTRNPV